MGKLINRMYEPWGYIEGTDYESLQAQKSSSDKAQNELDSKQDEKLNDLEQRLEAEIKRSKDADETHSEDIASNKDNITNNANELANKADKDKAVGKVEYDKDKKSVTISAVDGEELATVDMEHTHEITDLRQDGSEDIVINANETY